MLNPLIIVAEVLSLWGPEGPLVLEVDASRRQGRLVSFWCLCSLLIKVREEVETRKMGRNETWTFQGLFPRCTEVDEKPGEKHDIIVSFLMKRAWMAE